MKTNFSTEAALDLLQVHGIDFSGGKMDVVRHDELCSKISADCYNNGVRITGVDTSLDGNVVSLSFEGKARALKKNGVGTVMISTRTTLSYSADRIRNLDPTAWEDRKKLFVLKLIEAMKFGVGCSLPDEGGISVRILQEIEEELPRKVAEAIEKTITVTGAAGISKLSAGVSRMMPNVIERFLKARSTEPEEFLISGASGQISSGRQITLPKATSLSGPVFNKDDLLPSLGLALATSGGLGSGRTVPSKLVFDKTDADRNLVKFVGKDGQQFTLTREALIGLVTSGMLDIRDLKGVPQDLFESLGGVTKPTEDGIRKLKLDDDKTGS